MAPTPQFDLPHGKLAKNPFAPPLHNLRALTVATKVVSIKGPRPTRFEWLRSLIGHFAIPLDRWLFRTTDPEVLLTGEILLDGQRVKIVAPEWCRDTGALVVNLSLVGLTNADAVRS